MSAPSAEATVLDALLLSLPTRSATTRMRVWRALKTTGCATLRDGVYVLPKGAQQAAALSEIRSLVEAGGGFAMTAELTVEGTAALAHVRGLFDRTREFGALVHRMNAVRGDMRGLGKRRSATALARLRRALDELSASDFYPGHASVQAKEAMAALEREARDLFENGEPRASRARLRRLDPARFRGRTWATRRHPWIDRLACAWLIRRFIDPDARFVWIERPRDCPKRAVGFDFDGADFTHAGHRVTYEVLLASFGLDGDRALASIGAAVHFLDIGGIPVPDAKGLETILTGLRQKARNDDELVQAAAKIFDVLYVAYAPPAPER